jgi:hypothetical protein
MAGREAVWHVVINDNEHGPLTKSQVLEHLKDGLLTASNLIWRPGFPDWKSISEVSDFWQPPKRLSAKDAVQPPPLPAANVEPAAAAPIEGKTKWSLWKSANIGHGVTASTLLLQIVSGRGFELADSAHTASTNTMAYLFGVVICVPLWFVLVAVVCNLFFWRRPKSRANAAVGMLIFVVLFLSIFGALMVYGEVFFSSDEIISGEFRKKVVADAHNACVRKQHSLGQNVTEAQIDKYCTCYAEKMADGTSYKQLGAELNRDALARLKQRVEAISYECR